MRISRYYSDRREAVREQQHKVRSQMQRVRAMDTFPSVTSRSTVIRINSVALLDYEGRNHKIRP